MSLEDVMNRDQRTAKTRVFSSGEDVETKYCDFRTSRLSKIVGSNKKNCCLQSSSSVFYEKSNSISYLKSNYNNNVLICDIWCNSNKDIMDNSHKNFCKRKRRSCAMYFWNTLGKLKNVLLLTTCLTLLTFPSSLAAPRSRRMTCNKPAGMPKWVHPCGKPFETARERIDLKKNYLGAVSDTAWKALVNTVDAKDKYAKQIKSEAETLNENYQRHMYEGQESWLWLPILPNNKTSQEFFEHVNKNWDEVLLDLYKNLQTYAVGLEQITFDLKDNPQDDLENTFVTIEGHLKTTLCELHSVLAHHGVKIENDVSRDVMPDSLRCQAQQTDRVTRDWIILTEYVNALEFMNNVLEHLKQK